MGVGKQEKQVKAHEYFEAMLHQDHITSEALQFEKLIHKGNYQEALNVFDQGRFLDDFEKTYGRVIPNATMTMIELRL
ncbi:MAG: hypothetical protein R2880_05005 [Deinococcales bacterium]